MLYYEELEQWENIFNNTLSPSDGMDIDTPKFCESDLHPGDADAERVTSPLSDFQPLIGYKTLLLLLPIYLYSIQMNLYEHIWAHIYLLKSKQRTCH